MLCSLKLFDDFFPTSAPSSHYFYSFQFCLKINYHLKTYVAFYHIEHQVCKLQYQWFAMQFKMRLFRKVCTALPHNSYVKINAGLIWQYCNLNRFQERIANSLYCFCGNKWKKMDFEILKNIGKWPAKWDVKYKRPVVD